MNERGFALPITLFLIAILTLMLGSAFTRAATESQIAGGSKATVDALFVAQAGLQKYFGEDFTMVNRPLSGDSVRLDVPGGWAWIVPEVLQTPADTMDNFRYIIRSTGYAEDPQQPGSPLAVHTVAQFADWQTPWLSAPSAALIAANGVLTFNGGGTIRIDGTDLSCGVNEPAVDLLVPADTVGQAVTYLDPTYATWGNPPAPTPAGTAYFWADSAGIEWDSILAGTFQANHSSFQQGDWSYSSQLVTGDLALGGWWKLGTGILIVTGDLDITSRYFFWYGIILVGGELTISTRYSATISGAVITGLNHLTSGPPPGRTQLWEPRSSGRTLQLRYSSCYIQRALSSEKGFIPIENTWIDNWATF